MTIVRTRRTHAPRRPAALHTLHVIVLRYAIVRRDTIVNHDETRAPNDELFVRVRATSTPAADVGVVVVRRRSSSPSSPPPLLPGPGCPCQKNFKYRRTFHDAPGLSSFLLCF